MNTLTLLCFLVLLALPFTLADNPKITREDDDDDELFESFLDFPDWESHCSKKPLSNVDAFGAVGDGVSDDTKVGKCCSLSLYGYV